MRQYLSDCASQIGIDITDQQLNQFQMFYDMLLETNKVMNLTAITDMKDVVIKHFIDSISLLNHFSLKGLSVIDVGTGAGFPGIPLAIMCPDTNFMLLDSLNKRLKFLDQVIKACDLNNISYIHYRAEDGARDNKLREQYDICVSRAVANLSTLLEYCSPFVKPGGQFISYKSGDVKEELQVSKNAQKILHCEYSKLISFDLPESDLHRSFVIFNKTSKLSKKYPRQAGKAKRDPL